MTVNTRGQPQPFRGTTSFVNTPRLCTRRTAPAKSASARSSRPHAARRTLHIGDADSRCIIVSGAPLRDLAQDGTRIIKIDCYVLSAGSIVKDCGEQFDRFRGMAIRHQSDREIVLEAVVIGITDQCLSIRIDRGGR